MKLGGVVWCGGGWVRLWWWWVVCSCPPVGVSEWVVWRSPDAAVYALEVKNVTDQ